MQLSELIKIGGSMKSLADKVKLSSQNLYQKANTGWKVGVLDGKVVMYSPKSVQALDHITVEQFKHDCEIMNIKNSKGKDNG